MGAGLSTSVGVDMIECETLELQILIEVYLHGYVDDTPVHLLEAGWFGDGAAVPPEVNRS